MSPQQTIAHYRITSKLGEGGMGEVWRATDTKLNRDVAIKIIPEAFVQDADRMARFKREAQVLASLNHPNIAAIYGVEERALVMELVEGPTLAERIAQGPLPLDEALPIARQMAEALEYAHEKGVIHRDLKPANVKITPESRVKVLDFGLAKALSNEAASTDPASSPTLTMRATLAGAIMGTAAYMSPEQAKGKPVDRRADIWAFGVVLAEMLTGRQMYRGETVSEILAAVLLKEPDWSGLPAATPSVVRRLLRRCLEKDPLRRLRDIGEARIAIEEGLDGAPAENDAPAVVIQHRMLPWAVAIAGALALALIVTGVFLWRATRPVAHPLIRFSVDLGTEAQVGERFLSPVLLSPDGARMVFVSRGANGVRQLSTRPLDQARVQTLAGTENANDPFFSPDGQWIGFFADQKLKKISVQGGTAVTVCDAPNGRGGTWGEDGNIIAALRLGGPLERVFAAGGTPQALTRLDAQRGDTAHRFPQILPGGKAVLFTAIVGGDPDLLPSLEVQSLQTGLRKTLLRGGFFGRYLPSGHLVYMRQDTLYAAPMDLDKLELTGPSVPILEDVANIPGPGRAQFDFSRTGTFVYVSRTGTAGWLIAWLDSTGTTRPLRTTPGRYFYPSFSPDGKLLAISVFGAIGRPNLVVYDWQRDTMTKLGSTPGPDYSPVWTPDGKGIVYQSRSAGGFGIFWVRSDGASASVQLTDSKNPQAPRSFSPGGKRLAYSETGETQADLWTLPIDWSDPEHPKPGQPELFLRFPAVESDPIFSPDGRWIAYGSNEGLRPEVYVRPFPPDPSGGKWQVSNGGGSFAVWSRNGRELFYQLEDQIMVVSYTVKGASFIADKPRLWSGHRIFSRAGFLNYDLAPDGKRFAILESPEAEARSTTQANVLLNFFDELRRRTQTGGK